MIKKFEFDKIKYQYILNVNKRKFDKIEHTLNIKKLCWKKWALVIFRRFQKRFQLRLYDIYICMLK